jgi:vitamin B12 transporter
MKNPAKKYFIGLAIFLALFGDVNAQFRITGSVVNGKKEPVRGASILIKGSRGGVNTDSAGSFECMLPTPGKWVIEVSSVGYLSKKLEVDLRDSSTRLDIVLEDKVKSLGEVVVISAGSFEASDKAKGASLTPMDAVTVAGSGGDIANSLRSLPGAQQIGEQEGLFVRGGSSGETKQFVDGALLPNPNYASVPGLPQPARINPFVFNGILFSTGGYSALYGDALSSALILESIDLPDKSSASLHIFPQNIGAGYQELAANGKSSYGVDAGYGNMRPYNGLIAQKPDFFQGPEYLSGNANFRVRTSKTGMLKLYTNYGYSNIGMRNPDIDSSALVSSFAQKNTNLYANLSYRESLGNNWKIDAATAYNLDKDKVTDQLLSKQGQEVYLPDYPYNEKNNTSNAHSDFWQGRVVLRKQFVHNQALRVGAEYFYTNDRYVYHSTTGDSVTKLRDNLVAAFAESDIYITRNIAAKIGLRTEHSSLLDEYRLAPRISLAYKWRDGGQINMAYGVFWQKPENMYLSQRRNLDFTQATHYIINYQKKENNRLFRIEAYYKQYDALVTTSPKIANSGDGYARGIELFWRDKKTFKGVDYWFTYTYLDTKRKYLDFPYSVRPDFSTPHTFSLAVKKYFADINLSVNMSYTVATGRPYYDIQTDSTSKSIMTDRGTTNAYDVMNLSFAYLFNMFPKWRNKGYSGIGAGINNVFGVKEIFGYNYSNDGRSKVPVVPPAVRTYYIGLFMSFGIDRRDDFIKNNLQ